MQQRTIQGFEDYELIDSGHFRKLERFGPYTLDRPEPQAIWRPALSGQEWQQSAQAVFTRKDPQAAADAGNWSLQPGMPDQWHIRYKYKSMHLTFRLGMTAFKHLGIFPEQAANWDYLYDAVLQLGGSNVSLLNLFAYTGGASLAAKAAGADGVHLDAVKPVVTWARENMESSGLSGIRWLVEDALKFVRKEAKRGRRYQGLVLDPPAYGRGPEGEKWVLEKDLADLMEACAQILDPERQVVVLNLYSMGYSPLMAANLIKDYFPNAQNLSYGELYVTDRAGRQLPLGIYARFSSGL